MTLEMRIKQVSSITANRFMMYWYLALICVLGNCSYGRVCIPYVWRKAFRLFKLSWTLWKLDLFYDLFIFSLLCRVLKQLFGSFQQQMTASCKYHDIVDQESRGVTTILVSCLPLFLINELPSIIYCLASVWYKYMIYFIIPRSFEATRLFSLRH